MAFEVKPLEMQYLKEYVDFKNKTSQETNFIDPTTLEKASKLFKQWSNSKERAGFILLHDNKVMGQLFLVFKNKGTICHISLVSVLKEYYGTGAVDIFLDYVLKVCNDKNIVEVQLDVDKDNGRAIAYYVKKGFKLLKKVDKTYLRYQLKLKTIVTEVMKQTTPCGYGFVNW